MDMFTSILDTDERKAAAELEAASLLARTRWAQAHGLAPVQTGKRCICRLRSNHKEIPHPPYCDHGSLWVDASGKPVCWTMQPYAPLGPEALEALESYAAVNGFRLVVNESPAWRSNKCLLIEFWKGD